MGTGGAATIGTWTARPLAARALTVVVHAIPVAISLAWTAAIARLVERPAGLGETVVWWISIAGTATIVLAAADRLTRRLLPLAVLLRLSLAFPDAAPSRLRVALRAGDTTDLARRVDLVRREGLGPTPGTAAERLLELVGMLNAHDHRTRGHSERVRAYTTMIGRHLRLSRRDLDRLQWAALLHDVGKLFVPVEVLEKPSRLTDEEFEIVKKHPDWGAQLVAPLEGWLGEWALAVPQHHERWDGTGYPRGLRGMEISTAARIVAVADAYDVLTSARSYKEPVPAGEARREIARGSGTHFDPQVVRAFLRVTAGRIRPAAGPLTWIAQIPLLHPVAWLAPATAPVAATSALAGVALGSEAAAVRPGGPEAGAGALGPGAGGPPAGELPPAVDQSSPLPTAPRPGPRFGPEPADRASEGPRPPAPGGPLPSLAAGP